MALDLVFLVQWPSTELLGTILLPDGFPSAHLLSPQSFPHWSNKCFWRLQKTSFLFPGNTHLVPNGLHHKMMLVLECFVNCPCIPQQPFHGGITPTPHLQNSKSTHRFNKIRDPFQSGIPLSLICPFSLYISPIFSSFLEYKPVSSCIFF